MESSSHRTRKRVGAVGGAPSSGSNWVNPSPTSAAFQAGSSTLPSIRTGPERRGRGGGGEKPAPPAEASRGAAAPSPRTPPGRGRGAGGARGKTPRGGPATGSPGPPAGSAGPQTSATGSSRRTTWVTPSVEPNGRPPPPI